MTADEIGGMAACTQRDLDDLDRQAMREMNIYQRINAIRKEVRYVQKITKVKAGEGTYLAVTHDTVTAKIRDHLIEYGIICVPTLMGSASHAVGIMGKQARYDATYKFTFINSDKPSESIEIVMEAHAMDTQDKAPGKALSYAKKYAILKLFEIESGDKEEERIEEEPDTDLVNEEQVADMRRLITASKTEGAKFLRYYKVNSLEEMTIAGYKRGMASLREREKNMLDEAKVTS